jgi:regulator of sirC expression with transglutaminase-like and TPR domain
VDATEEFLVSVGRTEGDTSPERLALLIAAHARPSLDIATELAPIDRIADSVEHGSIESLRQVLFVEFGFIGNTTAYYDADNSMLDMVITRRTGIPITLSVLTMAVARRCGIDLLGIGMPGHFLVRSAADATTFLDPFGGGTVLDVEGCAGLFRHSQGATSRWDPAYVQPVGTVAIIQRMLDNLLAIHRSRGDAHSQLWVARLRAGLPTATRVHRTELAVALANCGRFDAAADLFDQLSQESDPATSSSLRSARDRMRSLMN